MSDNISELRGLWRGKDVDGGIWVTGDLLQIPELDGHGKIVSTKPAIMERTPVAKCYYVDPSTLGECVGRCNKNKTPIFEDDIVKHNGECYVIKYLEKYMRFSPIKPGTVFAVFDYTQAEVIGNIFDNPELLKGGK